MDARGKRSGDACWKTAESWDRRGGDFERGAINVEEFDVVVSQSAMIAGDPLYRFSCAYIYT